MRILGRTISPWWFLLFALICILSLPALLFLFIAGNLVIGAILGPPAIWNRTWHSPAPAALVGKYRESERNWNERASPEATMELRGNGSAVASTLPPFASSRTCILSGTGTWSGRDTDGEVQIQFPESVTAVACGIDRPAYASFTLAGHSQPYSLYLVIGDPDSGTGIWFERQPKAEALP